MPTYQFSCEDCSITKGKAKNRQHCIPDEDTAGWHPHTGDYMFYVRCKMSDKPKNPKCPKCHGQNTISNLFGQETMSWIRGNGIVNDKAGARRDMNRHTLENNDPYGHMRQSGEVDHMLDQCRRGGMDSEKMLKKSAKLSNEVAAKVRKRSQELLSEEQTAVMMKMAEDDVEFEVFNEFDDINKVLSSLIPNYVFQRKNGKFTLMALGRSYIDSILDPQ